MHKHVCNKAYLIKPACEWIRVRTIRFTGVSRTLRKTLRYTTTVVRCRTKHEESIKYDVWSKTAYKVPYKSFAYS